MDRVPVFNANPPQCTLSSLIQKQPIKLQLENYFCTPPERVPADTADPHTGTHNTVENPRSQSVNKSVSNAMKQIIKIS